MIPLGLSATQQAALLAALTTDHLVHVSVYLTNTAGAKLANLSDRLLDGQVDIDADGDVTRSAAVSLLDPQRSLSFDANSPNEAAVYFDRMVQINYSVSAPSLAGFGIGWITIPLFTGPIVKLDRSDDIVNIDCEGKEVLAMGQVWKPHTYPKGARKIDVIVDVLKYRSGETKFDIPQYGTLMPTNLAVGHMDTPWGIAKQIANGMGLQLFYDGRGTCRLRPRSQTSVYRFRTGDDEAVITPPKITPILENLKNRVWVHGSIDPGGGLSEYKIGAVAVAPLSHPMSAVRLGRNGVPRELVEEIDNATVTTQYEAQAQADAILNARLLESITVEFDSMPIPLLEELDVCRLETDRYSNAFRFTKASIPLVVSDTSSMSVGYVNRLSAKPRYAALQNMAPGRLVQMG